MGFFQNNKQMAHISMIIFWLTFIWIAQSVTMACGPNMDPNVKVTREMSGAPDNSLSSSIDEMPISQIDTRSNNLQYSLTEQTIYNILGEFNGTVTPLNSAGSLVSGAADLDCEFSASESCCWHNIAGTNDDLDWHLMLNQPATESLQEMLGKTQIPVRPFAVAAAKTVDGRLIYAFLTSCPIMCQKGSGSLYLDQWSTSGVIVDVCVLPVGGQEFTYCQSMQSSDEVSVQVVIPPQPRPFTLIVVASEFNGALGGLAIIDNIRYEADVCDSVVRPTTKLSKPKAKKPTTTQEPFGSIFDEIEIADEVDEINEFVVENTVEQTNNKVQTLETAEPDYSLVCAAIGCDWTREDVCNGLPLSKAEQFADRAIPFERTNGRVGNYAAGVHRREDMATYFGGELPPRSVLYFKSAAFELPTAIDVQTEFFESSEGVNFMMCLDQIDAESCHQLSPYSVQPEHRRWRPARFAIPATKPGKLTTLYLLAENNGLQQAAVGVYNLKLSTFHRTQQKLMPIKC